MARLDILIWIFIGIGAAAAVLIAVLIVGEKKRHQKTAEGYANAPKIPRSISKGDIAADVKADRADYDVYIMTAKEKYINIALAGAVIFIVGYLFYRSFIMALFITPLAFLYPKFKTKEIIRKRKTELNIQFKEALYSLSSSLSAGKSIETAFKDALRDLSIQYQDSQTFILKELEYIVRKIEMNETVETALLDFAARAHIEDIQSFADVFDTCKRTGGNLVQVIKNSTDIINDKIQIKQEIETMLAEKRFEQKILSLMPIGLILLLSLGAAEFMAPVFTGLEGRIVMSLSILLFIIAYFISKKIMDIEV